MSFMEHVKRRFNPLWILVGLAGAAVLAFLLGLFVMLLWNWLMPAIFGLGVISYWQAWGLVLLSHILFKSGPHSQRYHRYKHDGDWKEKFKEKMKRYHGYSEDTETT